MVVTVSLTAIYLQTGNISVKNSQSKVQNRTHGPIPACSFMTGKTRGFIDNLILYIISHEGLCSH
jgi:hypothetical protein